MATFAESQVTRLETLLAANVGVKSITIAGESVTYDDLLRQYDFWKSRVAREQGTRPRAAQIDLGGF